ncbi:hypothetical protein C8R47DRAFT_1159280 [Mycena vitilis]|nr:hypothetical protein C8R47DRAFT_1159280 [Mycena vitilis]
MDNPFYAYYHRGLKQNSTHYQTYCKECVNHRMVSVGASLSNLTRENPAFVDACDFVGSTRSDKLPWISHLIGGQGKVACIHASETGRAYATAQRQAIQNAKDAKVAQAALQASQAKKRTHADSTAGSSDVTPAPPAKKQQLQTTLSTLVFRRNDMPYSKACVESRELVNSTCQVDWGRKGIRTS